MYTKDIVGRRYFEWQNKTGRWVIFGEKLDIRRNDITWESLAPAYKNSNFFKIDVDVIKGDSPNRSKTTTALEKNEIDNIHAVGNTSDGFDEIPMKYFSKKTKRASGKELLNELKSLLHNPNVLEKCFDDLKIHLMEMVELLKNSTLVDHGLVEENNTTNRKDKRKYLETLSNLSVPAKCQKLSGRVGKGNESHKYFTLIKIPKNLNIATKILIMGE